MKTPARHLRTTFAGLLVVAVAATGCGSSSSSGASGASSSSGGAAAATSAAAAVTSAAAGAASTSAAAAGSAPAAATTAAAATTPDVAAAISAAAKTTVKATGGGDFCKNLALFINNSQNFTGTTPAEVKATVAKSEAESSLLVAEAPSAIKADLVTLFTATTALFDAVVKANYDYSKIPPAALAGLSAPAVTAAEAHADGYVKTTCGIDVGASASS
jgi:hypothetical protein